jgi:choline dehydrogenase
MARTQLPSIYPGLVQPIPYQSPTNLSGTTHRNRNPNLNSRAPPPAQGHALGGGTAINYLGYCRGAPSVFDEWADIAGDPELKWEALLNNFLAISHYASAGYVQDIDKDVYGHGPIEASHPAKDDGFNPYYVSALKHGLGLPEVDGNDGSGLGVSHDTSASSLQAAVY